MSLILIYLGQQEAESFFFFLHEYQQKNTLKASIGINFLQFA